MNCKNILSKELYIKLYNQGLTDKEIANQIGMNLSYISKYRKNKLKLPLIKDIISLNKFQEEVLIGTILGDSSIRFVHSKMKNSNLTFTHTPKNREYFLLKYNIFKNIISSIGEYTCKSKFVKGNKLVATGKALACMNIYQNIFYKNKIKIIPIEYLKQNFTNISLAFLFMDDGNKNGKTINLNMQSFTLDELNQFVNFLKDKFNLEFNIKKDKTLYLKYKSRTIFYNLVQDYIIDKMKYKLEGIKLSLNSVNCLGNPEMGNQQPSSYSDIEKGSTTSSESQRDNNSTMKAGQYIIGIDPY
jgi:transcriptional regulator with XRE-family HTH domain